MYAREWGECLLRPPGDESARLEGSHPMNRVWKRGDVLGWLMALGGRWASAWALAAKMEMGCRRVRMGAWSGCVKFFKVLLILD